MIPEKYCGSVQSQGASFPTPELQQPFGYCGYNQGKLPSLFAKPILFPDPNKCL